MSENKEQIDVMTLEFDDGEEVECEVIGIFDFENEEFIALAPDDGSGDVYIYQYKDMGEDFEIEEIEDDEKYEAVAREFESLLEEEIEE